MCAFLPTFFFLLPVPFPVEPMKGNSSVSYVLEGSRSQIRLFISLFLLPSSSFFLLLFFFSLLFREGTAQALRTKQQLKKWDLPPLPPPLFLCLPRGLPGIRKGKKVLCTRRSPFSSPFLPSPPLFFQGRPWDRVRVEGASNGNQFSY